MKITIQTKPSPDGEYILLGAELDFEDGSAPKDLTPASYGKPMSLTPDVSRRQYDFAWSQMFSALEYELQEPVSMAKVLWPDGLS